MSVMTVEVRHQRYKDKVEMYENTDPKKVFWNKGELIWSHLGQFFVNVGDGRSKAITGIYRSKTRIHYFLDGVKHRTDGPAVVNILEGKQEFWLKGQKISEEEFREQYLVIHLKEYHSR